MVRHRADRSRESTRCTARRCDRSSSSDGSAVSNTTPFRSRVRVSPGTALHHRACAAVTAALNASREHSYAAVARSDNSVSDLRAAVQGGGRVGDGA